MLVGEELNWGCSGIGTSLGANGLGAGAGDHRRHRRAEGGVAAAAARGADPLLVRPLRARRGLRRRAAQDDRRAPRRRVRPQRLEDLHHERGLRRLDGRLREDRSRRATAGISAFIVPMDTPGVTDRAAPRQDGAARDRHLGVRAPGRRRAGGEPARRGGRGLQDRDADARLHAAGHGHRRRRRRAGRVRARGRVREGAGHVRHADRDAPGRQLHDRRHGDRDRGRAPARLAGGVDARPGASARRCTRRSRSASPPTRR